MEWKVLCAISYEMRDVEGTRVKTIVRKKKS